MPVVDQSREKTVHPRGILIDWDLCKYRSELDSQPTQDTRSVSTFTISESEAGILTALLLGNVAFYVSSLATVPQEAEQSRGRLGIIHSCHHLLLPSLSLPQYDQRRHQFNSRQATHRRE